MRLYSPVYLLMPVLLLFPPQCRFYSASYKSFGDLTDRVRRSVIRFLYLIVRPFLVFWDFIQFQQYLGVFDSICLGSPFSN